nr:retrovirus-related Pol polyprotein from transposon TNT 1-94 [Tanacetum cinerariifolium]
MCCPRSSVGNKSSQVSTSSSRGIDQGLGSTSGIRACALRNFDLKVMEFESAQSNTTAKLPILKLGEYEMWVIRIKQYFKVQDYALWEVIENGNSWVFVPQTTQENGSSVTKMSIPTNKKNDVKARSLLLMALPNEHQLTFNPYSDAKTMFAAIENNLKDLEQIHEDDLEAMDLKWQLSLLKCFNCHKMRHFSKECRASRNQDGRFRNQENIRKQGNNEDTSSKAMLAIDGVGFDWSDMAKEQVQTNMALMAFLDSENGVAERRNRTLIEVARTMLADSKLPTTFWAEVVSTACYVQNKVLVIKPHNKTPYELFRGFKPALRFMRPFGLHVTILNTLDNLGKFDGKSDESFFVGYSLSSKAFRSKEVNAAGQHVNTASLEVNIGRFELNTVDPPVNTASSYDPHSLKDMFELGASHTLEATHVEFFSDEDKPKVDLGNVPNSYVVPTTPHTRIHNDHPIKNVIGDVKSFAKTRRLTKSTFEQGFLRDLHEEKTHDTLNTCLYACFLS